MNCGQGFVKDYKQYSLAAAVQLSNGLIVSLPKPARHNDIMYKLDKSLRIGAVQGFLLSNGCFADRITAAKIFIDNGGVLKHPPLLYSEDLW